MSLEPSGGDSYRLRKSAAAGFWREAVGWLLKAPHCLSKEPPCDACGNSINVTSGGPERHRWTAVADDLWTRARRSALPVSYGVWLKHFQKCLSDHFGRGRLNENTVRSSAHSCSSVSPRTGEDEAHAAKPWFRANEFEQLKPVHWLHGPIRDDGGRRIDHASEPKPRRRSLHAE
jgi:hypothetical protein